MNVLIIKGMKMPTDCTKCGFCDDETMFCWATREFISGFGHPKFCPLEEVLDSKEQENDKTLLKSEHDDVSKGDFISRRAAIDAICKTSCGAGCGIPCDEIFALEELPSAQPELIRCKDCKFYRCNGCFFSTAETEENGFCSWAERRTDERDDIFE